MNSLVAAIDRLKEIAKFAEGNANTNCDDRLTWGAHARACREVIHVLSTIKTAERTP